MSYPSAVGKVVGRGLGAGAPAPDAAAARGAAAAFFREVCRCLPWVVRTYKLDELSSVPRLRAHLAGLFREHAAVADPRAVDLLIFKGREELEMVLMQHKQRHHLVSRYVPNPQATIDAQQARRPPGRSAFLERFYASND